MGDANAGIQILVTAMGSNALQVAETRKLVDLLLNKKVTFEQIDGSSDADLRNKMWEKSGKRSYPQIFLNGEFWGDLDMIQVGARAGSRGLLRRPSV